MSTHVTSTTQMFSFIKRCREAGLTKHLNETVTSAILAEETRMAYIRSIISNNDVRGARKVYSEHFKSFRKCSNALNEISTYHDIHSPHYGVIELLNVFA